MENNKFNAEDEVSILDKMLNNIDSSDDLVEFLRVIQEDVEKDSDLREAFLITFLIELRSYIQDRKTDPDLPALPEEATWKLFGELILEGIGKI